MLGKSSADRRKQQESRTTGWEGVAGERGLPRAGGLLVLATRGVLCLFGLGVLLVGRCLGLPELSRAAAVA